MDGQILMGQASFDALQPRERARRCREMADELLDLSLTATNTETIIAYLDLAAHWLAQARGLEWDAAACLEENGSNQGVAVVAGKRMAAERGL